jgi:hypothetical protein
MTTSIAPDLPELSVPDYVPDLLGPDSVPGLARRLPPGTTLDADDVIAAIETLGVTDRTARERFGMPSVFSLGDAVLTHLRHGHAALQPRHGVRRAPARRRHLVAAMVRCALYLGPLSAAVAASGPLGRVAWPVPTTALILGWGGAQALACLGATSAGRVTQDNPAGGTGPAVATRLLAGGFGMLAGLWCALAWIAPAALVGPDRLLATLVGLGVLVCLATVTAALVTRTEVAVVRWSLPIWLLAAVSLAQGGTGGGGGAGGGGAGAGWVDRVPVIALLPAAILLAALRAYRPLIGRRVPDRVVLTRADLRHAGSYLIIGAAQAGCVALLWHTGAAGTPPPAVLPLLAAVPMLEALVAWHAVQLDAGLDDFDDRAAYGRHIRSVTVVTVAGLLPPFAVGVALTAAAFRLPYGLPELHGARDVVLALAGGTLLGGLLAATLLLAARGRVAGAAALAVAPLVLTAASAAAPGHWLPAADGSLDLLPIAVTLLAAAHLAGLLAVASTALDHRRTS